MNQPRSSNPPAPLSIPHEMVVANAGSGKTYSLTTRTIRLLAAGAEPQSVAALTFTKKAAAEFLGNLFVRLARAAMDPAEQKQLAEDIRVPDLDADRCADILRSLTDHLGELSMGTIDSLFSRIARAFPLESGFGGEFAVLGETSQIAALEEALAALFRACAGEQELHELLDLVRRQNRKAGERAVFATLFREVKDLQSAFLKTPPGLRWGDAGRIWPNGSPILSAASIDSAANDLLDLIEHEAPTLAPEALNDWRMMLTSFAKLTPGQSLPDDLKTFRDKKLIDYSEDKKDGRPYVPIGRKAAGRLYLTPEIQAARQALVRALLRMELEALLQRSEALQHLAALFEKQYHSQTRSQGLLTFDDIARQLAAQVESAEWIASVGYRLDCRFDHWLLDEFQDTSRQQWKILSAFIDEVLQDPEGRRTFYYVGDTKQAIYSWRGGDPTLFFEIKETYSPGDSEFIKSEELKISYRSGPVLLDCVNSIFGALDQYQEMLELPEKTISDWQEAWKKHEPSAKVARLESYVRWVSVEKTSAESDEEEPDEDAPIPINPLDAQILEILEETQPWRRRWDAAVLVRKNDDAERLASLLQERGIPVALEGKAHPCIDNPLCVTLLAAFRAAVSPEDSLARTLLLLSPLGSKLCGGPDYEFREQALQTIAAEGYAGAARRWIDLLVPPAEGFLAQRAGQFLSACEEFEAAASSSDGIYELVDFLEGFSIEEPEGSGVVRLMTIHKSKGLTFDMTIVRVPESLREFRAQNSLHLHAPETPGAWALLMPSAKFCQQDPVLDQAREEILAETAYANLCNAYVAFTRPRRGLYLVSKRLAEGTKAKNFLRLLRETLGDEAGFFERGNPRWFEERPLDTDMAEDVAQVAAAPMSPPLHGTPHALSPSRVGVSSQSDLSTGESSKQPGTNAADAMRIGTGVHALLSRIEWIGATESITDLVSDWQGDALVREIVLRFLAGIEGRKVFQKPDAPHWLWREVPFDVFIDGTWISGIIDRAVIFLDDENRPARAELIDFKTTASETPDTFSGAKFRPQLETYRKAAATMLRLSADSVDASIVPVPTA